MVVFASGTKTGGGSGFRHLAENCQTGVVQAEIVAVVSNHCDGGVYRHWQEMELPYFIHSSPQTADDYRWIIDLHKPDLVVLAGWLKFVVGIRDIPVINIHPGRLPDTAGLHGLAVHKEALKLSTQRRGYTTAVTIHHVPYQEEVDRSHYDTGKIIFEYPVAIRPDDTPETLAQRVNEYEHGWHSYVINLVATGQLTITGGGALRHPSPYPFLPKQGR